MMARRRSGAARRWPSIALVLAAMASAVVVPGASAQAEVGGSGVDTSLPATDSQVVVRGRGQFESLEVTVNQTRDLGNQAISITWTGGQPTKIGPARFAEDFLQIMQCWSDDGDPSASGPSPEQCVQGASDAVYGGRSGGLFPSGGFALERIISKRDWPDFAQAGGAVDERTGYSWMPFRAVDGTVVTTHYDPQFRPAVEGGSYWLNPYFNAITTNEIAGGRTGPGGRGAELFEVATGLESSGLGCGQKVLRRSDGSMAEPRCWLVIVPRGSAASENVGSPFTENPEQQGVMTSPLSARAWSNRIAIPLEFNPLDASCSLSDDERRIVGSELASAAVSSWQPELCATDGLPPFSFANIGDPPARGQIAAATPGGPGLGIVSRPIVDLPSTPADPIVYAPLTLSGVVIGFNVERNPKPRVSDAEELLRGVRVSDIDLTPRLVAKLLTQSYRSQTSIVVQSPHDFAAENPDHLAQDPDFLRFNPEFELLQTSAPKNFGGLVLPARNSDAARQVWEWILSDPEARAWLDGQPDQWGMSVNPAYSTSAARNPTGVAFAAPVPESFPKSDPYCYQAPPQGPGGSVIPPPLCGTDWLPYSQSMRDAARITRLAHDGARVIADVNALSSDRVYKADSPQVVGSRTLLSLTDTASATQFGLQVARLSRSGDDGDDRTFVAPTDGTLAAAVGGMPLVPGGSGVRVPDPTELPDGAYPLASLTYGTVRPARLDADARSDYAAFVAYAAGDGQVPGRDVGDLPPGYAPLPAALREQAVAAARRIAAFELPVEVAEAPTKPTESGSAMPDLVPTPGRSGRRASGAVTPAAPLSGPVEAVTAQIEDGGAEPADVPLLLTPVLALATSRFAVVGFALISIAATWMSLEITKRPRRRVRSSKGSAP